MSKRRRLAALPLAIVIVLGFLGSGRAATEPFGRLSVDEVSGNIAGRPGRSRGPRLRLVGFRERLAAG